MWVCCVCVHHAGSLLAVSPLGRVAKVQTLFTDLGVISHKVSTTQQQQQDYTQAPLADWLSAAAGQFSLQQAEVQTLRHQWSVCVMEAAVAEETQGQREQQVAHRQLKKLLRDFAELHSRTQ